MRASHRLNRRSFVTSVIGTAVGTGALGALTGTARAQTGPWTGVTDSDSGSYADNAGHGRGPGGNSSGQVQGGTGVTDNDPTDRVGYGRRPQTGYSDSDSGPGADPSGGGRRPRALQTGITDSDSYDRSGEGRGPNRNTRPLMTRPDGEAVEYTGLTDTDSGQSRDPSGYGRGSRECRDADNQGAAVDPQRWRNVDPIRRCE